MLNKIRCDKTKVVYRFDIKDLEAAKEIGKTMRIRHLVCTRLIYRGPRPSIRSWRTGKMVTPGYTLKKDAVAVDLYVYKK